MDRYMKRFLYWLIAGRMTPRRVAREYLSLVKEQSRELYILRSLLAQEFNELEKAGLMSPRSKRSLIELETDLARTSALLASIIACLQSLPPEWDGSPPLGDYLNAVVPLPKA